MTVAFIVDGHLEKKVVQRLCSDAPVRTTNLNGRDVTIKAVADRIITLARLLRGRYSPIVIIIDRERRTESSFEIEQQVKCKLESQGIPAADLIVSCPDRMIENWIVAGTTQFAGQEVFIECADGICDGCHGKSILKNFLKTCGTAYGETTVGVEMLCAIDFEMASTRSPSYARLHHQLVGFCPKLMAARRNASYQPS